MKFVKKMTTAIVVVGMFLFPTTANASTTEESNFKPIGTTEYFYPDDQSSDDVSSYGGVLPCLFRANSDNPHISSTSATPAVQVHGWWELLACDSPNWTATVSVQLQKKVNYSWVNVGPLSVRSGRRPGSGTANRVTAHYDCTPNSLAYNYRAVVDVDVEGAKDLPDKYISPEAILRCS